MASAGSYGLSGWPGSALTANWPKVDGLELHRAFGSGAVGTGADAGQGGAAVAGFGLADAGQH